LADYDKVIKDMLAGSNKKRVSISILGLGEDGHFASLFPASPAALVEAAFDPSKAVLGTTTDVFAVHNRITTTYPVRYGITGSILAVSQISF
jgi:6-phosphogluconolactonase/glucosamine-6-phosphate isomerase/deaminase